MPETKDVDRSAIGRRIEQLLQRLPLEIRYGDSNPPKVKRCPVCVSSLVFRDGRWECSSCRYRSEEKMKGGEK